MKQVLLFFGLVFFSTASYAQTFFLDEDFESANKSNPPSGWVSEIVANGSSQYDSFYFDDSIYYPATPIEGKYATFDAYNGGQATPNNTQNNGTSETVALVSPTVNAGSSTNLYLSFDYFHFPLANPAPSFGVDVSTNGGTSWTQAWRTTTRLGTTASQLLDLSTYKGSSSLKIRFIWTNTSTGAYAGWCYFDNVKLFQRNGNDVGVSAIVDPIPFACPDKDQALSVEVTNFGTNDASNIPVSLTVSGAASGSFSTTISSLKAGASTTVFTSSTINTSSGGDIDFKALTSWSSDDELANDTLETTVSTAPKPVTPVGTDATRCGIGSVELTATAGTNDSTFWFDAATGGQALGTGTSFTTPEVVTSRNFYVENSSIVSNTFSTFQGPYRYNGGPTGGSYFDLTAKNDIIVDALANHFAYEATGTVVKIYYKQGSYTGSQTTQGDWTLIHTETVDTKGFGTFEKFNLANSIRIPAGSTYGFYVTADGGSSPTFKLLSLNIDNVDLQVQANNVNFTAFGGTLNGYSWDGMIYYRKTCSSPRVPVKANVIRLPEGVEVKKGTVFNGQFKGGIPSNPDITNDTNAVSYTLTAPSNYTNADYGTGWEINVEALTVNGTVAPGLTITTPTGSTDGSYEFKPATGWEDSTVNICLKVKDFATGCDTAICRTLYIAPTPVVDFETKDVCLGEVIQFNNLSTISNGFMSYKWDFGNGDTSDLISPIYEFEKEGKYNVTLTAISGFNIEVSKTILVEVFEIPDIKFTVKNACEDVALEFGNTTTISSGTLSFNWEFGDGNTSTDKEPKHTYAAPGGYRVTLTASANGCASRLTKNANQFARPTADFSFTGFCTGSPIQFTNGSTIEFNEPIGAQWDFDNNGEIGTNLNPTMVYSTPGEKNVKLTAVSQFGCTDEITKKVTLTESPVASFQVDRLCDKSTTNFTNTSSEPASGTTVYTWNFGDGTTTADKDPSHDFGETGSFRVSLNATNTNGCSSDLSKNLKVLPEPIVDFSVSDGCAGEETVFLNKTKSTSGDISYTWNFGDGNSSNDVIPTHVYSPSSATTFNVVLTANVQDGCSGTKNGSVTVFEKPVCSFTFEQSSELRNEFTFTPTNSTYGAGAYTWVFLGEKTSTDVSPTVNFTYNETKYRVLLAVKTAAGCECADSSTFITTSWPLGVKDAYADLNSTVYPNPVNNELNIGLRSLSSDEVKITMVDLHGRIVMVETFSVVARGVYTIPTDGLAKGTYFVRVSQGDHAAVHQVVKH